MKNIDDNSEKKSGIEELILKLRIQAKHQQKVDEGSGGGIRELLNNLSEDDYMDLSGTPVWQAAYRDGYDDGQKAAFKRAWITISNLVDIFNEKD